MGAIFFTLGFLTAVLTLPLWGTHYARAFYWSVDRARFLCWFGIHAPEWLAFQTSAVGTEPATHLPCKRCKEMVEIHYPNAR